jgi:hypothetical protein
MQSVWTLTAASVALGLATGGVAGYWQYKSPTPETTVSTPMEAGATTGKPYQPVTAASPKGPHPAVHIEEPNYSFGTMEAGGKMSHEFVVHNRGDAPMTLKQGETTCKCTLSEVAGGEIPPGGSTTVKLEWRAESGPGPFRQSAAISTNDPTQPTITLTVDGEVTESVTINPHEVVFSNLQTTESSSATVKVYAFHADDLTFTGHTFDSTDGPQQFEVSYQPLEKDQIEDKRAKSGMLITIRSKPGLPLGPVRQKITFNTNLEHSPTINVPLSGSVSSDISIIGPDWSMSNGVLRLGVVESRVGAERTLKLVTRGPHSKTIEFKVVSQTPAFLQVSLGERKEMATGAVSQTPITIKVPKGSPAANHSGSEVGKAGVIKLETNHPDVQEVRLQVQFVVED